MNYTLAVDIDDTLSETAKTAMEMLQQKFKIHDSRSIIDLLREHKQPGAVNDWQTVEATSFFNSLINSDEFLYSLPVIEDAITTLNHLVTIGTISCYITSRLETHSKITKQWLDLHGFPEAPLITRPLDEHRFNWKLHYLCKTSYHSKNLFLIDDTETAFAQTPECYHGSGIIFDRWNIHTDTHTIPHAHSWTDIATFFTNYTIR